LTEIETRELVAANGSVPSAFQDPVFVLCNARSGSTVLRFLLDAHPELACPPETNLPGLCVQLATVWSLIEGAPLSANRGDEPPDIPEAAITGVRETMDRMLGSYLIRRGKKRYCDKSLGTARFAELLLRVYTEAKFVCVYRHPMDMIASGMEACPWGLNGYGFDPYISATPGNAVLALANFWADNTRATLSAEERFPDRCYRLRYEDLVTDPEGIAAGLFEFLGVDMVPGITDQCFSAERERFGPADYKIWSTSRISSGSIARGWSIPAGMIPPPVLAAVNELTEKLGYMPVDGEWGTTEPPADLRKSPEQEETQPEETGPAQEAAPAPAPDPVFSLRLADRLRAGLTSIEFTTRQETHKNETIVAVAVAKDSTHPTEYWLVDLAAGSVTPTTQDAQDESDWDVIAGIDAWEQVMDGSLNYYVALRSCQLRYCDNDETTTPLAAETRIGLLGNLLQLTAW
jgi:hypothetical protein